jgi:hypothetical protein
MYPLLDTNTLNRRAAEGRRAAEAARAAKGSGRGSDPHETTARHGVRHAVGASLVRAGLRLINA